MRWNEMTAPEFEEAVEVSQGVCLLPLGVIERHGSHLPLGIDYMKAWHYADLASRQEAAVVFPPFYFGLVNAAKFEPGAVAFKANLVLEVLDATCAEISRNGLRKIILVNAHGGNVKLLQTFLRTRLEHERNYMTYLCDMNFGERTEAAKDAVNRESGGTSGHGGAYETAVALRLFPDLVKKDKILPREAGDEDPRLRDVLGGRLTTPIDWYAKHHVHLGGYGGDVTGEHGREICSSIAKDLADTIRRVKEDNLSMELAREFYEKSERKSSSQVIKT